LNFGCRTSRSPWRDSVASCNWPSHFSLESPYWVTTDSSLKHGNHRTECVINAFQLPSSGCRLYNKATTRPSYAKIIHKSHGLRIEIAKWNQEIWKNHSKKTKEVISTYDLNLGNLGKQLLLNDRGHNSSPLWEVTNSSYWRQDQMAFLHSEGMAWKPWKASRTIAAECQQKPLKKKTVLAGIQSTSRAKKKSSASYLNFKDLKLCAEFNWEQVL
jgi:hypothetical protein